MWEYAYRLKSFELFRDIAHFDSLQDIFDHLAANLAKQVLQRVCRGIYRAYLERQELLSYLRGKVHIVSTTRAILRGSTRLVCEYEERTANLEENRILAWTLYILPRLPIQREDVRLMVRKAFRALAGAVEVSPVKAQDCINRHYHRLNDDYRPMHGLCRFFLENCGPDIKPGGYEMIPFVLYMPSLYELFVAEWLRENASKYFRVVPQYKAEIGGSDTLSFRIDLVLRDMASNKVLAVLDTKYKRKSEPDQADIQEIVAYAVRMGTNNAFLVYPSTATKFSDLSIGKIQVRSLIFDIGDDLEEGGRCFLKSLTEALGGQFDNPSVK
jgi:5-methylcytosine-specific restriction enzyme subunit McrC